MVQYAKIVLATRDRELQTFPNKYSVWITLLTILKEYTIYAEKEKGIYATRNKGV